MPHEAELEQVVVDAHEQLEVLLRGAVRREAQRLEAERDGRVGQQRHVSEHLVQVVAAAAAHSMCSSECALTRREAHTARRRSTASTRAG